MWGRQSGGPPGPRYLTPVAAGRAIRRDPLGFVTGLARDHGDVVLLRLGHLRVWFLFHPDHVRHVLQENHQNYVKGRLVARTRVLIGDGLFTSEGGSWLRQRRLAQPAFHRARIAALVGPIVDATAERLAGWDAAAARGAVVDVAAGMSALTLTIVGRALFGHDLGARAAEAGRALQAALAFTAARTLSYVALPLALPTPRHRAFRAAVRVLDDVVFGLIDARRSAGEAREDLLGLLMAARDGETGEALTPGQLRDQVMTFVLAGHETTAVALAWTCWLLARHPGVAAAVAAEVRDVLGGRRPAFDDVARLRLTRMAIEEAMRLYPPVWGIGRQAIGEDRIGGHRLPAGAVVNVSPWVTHRHPAFWPEPERFEPARFAPDAVASRPRFAYFPFGGGPRQCIGESFALLEAQLVLAMVVQRFHLALLPGHTVEPEVHLTLRPRGGLPMVLAPAYVAGTAAAAGAAARSGAQAPAASAPATSVAVNSVKAAS
jgi:cytochrome P450